MKKSLFTIRELSTPERLNRSPNWIRRAIQLGKIEAEKAGNTYVVDASEVNRVKKDMPKISYKEMFSRVGES